MMDHEYTFQALKFFGIPKGLNDNIKTLINNPITMLNINGNLSLPFKQSIRGSGQGDNVSAYLSNFCIQPLLLKLAFSPEVVRPKINYINKDNQLKKT